MYIPHFSPDEFRAPTGHYRLARARGGDILYAYIRKNSSTAFKQFINRRPHPRYLLKSLLGIEKFPKMHLKGNMRYSRVPRTGNLETIGCDTAIFVYRDPAERLVSAFMNKFIDDDGSMDIKSNYSRVMGKEPEDATFRDFIAYAALGFAEIDVHLHPQKAHLWDIPYQPIPMGHLKEALSVMLPKKTVERYFGRKHN